MTQIIAEIGWNHMGDITLAEKMIIEAKNAGQIIKISNLESKTFKKRKMIWMEEEIFTKSRINK